MPAPRRTQQQHDRRWVWFGQVRDAVALCLGTVVVIVETFRGTYDPVAMGFAGVCLAIFTAGTVGRWLVGKVNGNESRR